MPRRISTVCGREFGEGVRAQLQRAGLSANQASELLGWDHGKLSDLVNGKGGADAAEVMNLLGVCRTPPAERDRLMALFKESREKGWLQFPESGVPDQVLTLIKHEKVATGITAWNMNLIPGLLQTPDYARAVVHASALVPVGDVEALVAARIARREVLRRECQFTFYIHQQALLLPVGGPEVMSDQLHDLLRMWVRPYITMRIIPTTVGAHAGTAGDFRLMTFAKYPPVVYVESLNSGLFLDDEASLKDYQKVLKSLDRIALGVEESREVITDIAT